MNLVELYKIGREYWERNYLSNGGVFQSLTIEELNQSFVLATQAVELLGYILANADEYDPDVTTVGTAEALEMQKKYLNCAAVWIKIELKRRANKEDAAKSVPPEDATVTELERKVMDDEFRDRWINGVSVMAKRSQSKKVRQEQGFTKSQLNRIERWVKMGAVTTKKQARPVLGYVYRCLLDSGEVVVGADGYRMHVSWQPEVIARFPDIWTPASNYAVGDAESMELMKYMNFGSIIPSRLTSFTVFAQDIEAAVKRVRVFGRQVSDSDPITLQTEVNKLTVSACVPDVGDVTCEMEAVTPFNFPHYTQRMSGRFLQEALYGFENETPVSFHNNKIIVGKVGEQVSIIMVMG